MAVHNLVDVHLAHQINTWVHRPVASDVSQVLSICLSYVHSLDWNYILLRHVEHDCYRCVIKFDYNLFVNPRLINNSHYLSNVNIVIKF